MKILQAIVSSSPETLDGRQGFGLVICSRLMPDAVRKVARDWEYPSHGDGKPVYSFLIVADRDVSWAVMNHTIPATDFTGRSSYVSHTLAIRLDELFEWFGQRPGHVVTPFEVMHDFKWQQAWTEADSPHFIESEVDMEIGDVFSQKTTSEGYRPPGIAASPLLAFDYSENGDIKPKRVGWKVGTGDPGEMLGLFHSAWITLDPWRGTRKYGDHLGEPNVSLMDSWGCTFATDLRGGRPDEYDWVVLASDEASIASRKIIDVVNWSQVGEDDVVNVIGGELGRLLVDRSKDPDGWAHYKIREKIAHIAASYRERIGEQAKGTEDEIKKLIASVEDYTKGWNEFVKKDLDAALVDASKILSAKESEKNLIVESAKQHSATLNEKFKDEISPLLDLPSVSLQEDAIGDIESIWNYPELEKHFDYSKQNLLKIYPYGITLKKVNELEDQLEEKTGLYNNSYDELRELRISNDKNLKSLERLVREKSEKAIGKPSLADKKVGKNKNLAWQLYSLIGMAIILIIFSVMILFQNKDIKLENAKLEKKAKDYSSIIKNLKGEETTVSGANITDSQITVSEGEANTEAEGDPNK